MGNSSAVAKRSNGVTVPKFTMKEATPLLMLAGLWLIADKVFGKPKPVPEQPLPNSGMGIPEGWSADSFAKALFDAYSGITTPFSLNQVNAVTLAFVTLDTPDMFTAVVNRFNAAYDDTGEGLRAWIEDEYFINPSLKAQALARFTKLGLKGYPNNNIYMNQTLVTDINCLTNDAEFIGNCIIPR